MTKTLLLVVITCGALIHEVSPQLDIKILDSPPLASFVRTVRQALFRFIGTNSNNPHKVKFNHKYGKLQRQFPPEEPFPCDTTGMRSPTVPESIHALRPGDIDIVAALGDSLTAGSGALATHTLELLTENKGISWSIGGQGTWRQFLTIPNILKEFNPRLYGYSITDGLSFHRTSRFNAAEVGAMTQDLPYQAKNLVKRMKNDPKVDLNKQWKLVTILIGYNDFCSNICYLDNSERILTDQEQNLVRTLRILREYLPRTMVNLVATPNIKLLTTFRRRTKYCVTANMVECSCMFGTQFQHMRTKLFKIADTWNELQHNVTKRDEFHSKSDFTVNFQPFAQSISIPRKADGGNDFTYMSLDCFHLSQKGYALAANALWNNMLEPEGKKSGISWREFEHFRCPTQEHPFLMTRENRGFSFDLTPSFDIFYRKPFIFEELPR